MNARTDYKPVPPFQLLYNNLGFGESTRIDFIDSTGARWMTNSVERILYDIDHFSGRHQLTLLAGAALHYGFDSYAFMGANFQQKWNVLDVSGRVLLADVTHEVASAAVDAYMAQPGWVGDMRIRRQDDNAVGRNGRHRGPLQLLYHALGVSTWTGVAVKSHAGRCGMQLQEVLRRLYQFDAAEQAEILAGMARHFGVPAEREAAGQGRADRGEHGHG